MGKIICVLVTYNPDLQLLYSVINAIYSQVDTIWISDNSTDNALNPSQFETSSKILYKKMPGNIGIAAAQNYGIKYALENGFDYLYFLDQDSLSPTGIIKELLSQYVKLISKNINVGAVGPRPFNRKEGKEYRGSVKKGYKIDDEITEVTEIISSASFIAVSTFKKVGLMDERLFIDGVDHEWCWRATAKTGARFFIAETVNLSHQLGEGDHFFLYRKVAIPTPFRTYYQFRNYFVLLRRKYVPLYWKVSNGIKYFVKYFYFPLFIFPRNQYFKNINRGIHDGICWKA